MQSLGEDSRGSSPKAHEQYIVIHTRGGHNCHESVAYSQHLIVAVTTSVTEENNMSAPHHVSTNSHAGKE